VILSPYHVLASWWATDLYALTEVYLGTTVEMPRVRHVERQIRDEVLEPQLSVSQKDMEAVEVWQVSHLER